MISICACCILGHGLALSGGFSPILPSICTLHDCKCIPELGLIYVLLGNPYTVQLVLLFDLEHLLHNSKHLGMGPRGCGNHALVIE